MGQLNLRIGSSAVSVQDVFQKGDSQSLGLPHATFQNSWWKKIWLVQLGCHWGPGTALVSNPPSPSPIVSFCSVSWSQRYKVLLHIYRTSTSQLLCPDFLVKGEYYVILPVMPARGIAKYKDSARGRGVCLLGQNVALLLVIGKVKTVKRSS